MMVPVALAKIIINEKEREQIILLREKDGTRQVPIIIGFAEASSIQMFIVGIRSPRPLTHDLLANVIKGLGAEMESLSIDDVSEGTFFAHLRMKNSLGIFVDIDCRPSDGVALAVRLGIPMFVAASVFVKIAVADS